MYYPTVCIWLTILYCKLGNCCEGEICVMWGFFPTMKKGDMIIFLIQNDHSSCRKDADYNERDMKSP